MVKTKNVSLKEGLSLQRNIISNNKIFTIENDEDKIPRFEDFKLRPVNRDVKNISNSINNTIIKKIGRKIYLNSDEVYELNGDYLELLTLKKIEKDSDENEKIIQTHAYSLKRNHDFNEETDGVYTGVLRNGDKEIKFSTIISTNPQKNIEFKSEGLYRIRGTKYYKHMLSYSSIKGLLYLFNKIGNYLSVTDNLNSVIYDLYLDKSRVHTPNNNILISLPNKTSELDNKYKDLSVLSGLDVEELVSNNKYIKHIDRLFVKEDKLDDMDYILYDIYHINDILDLSFMNFSNIFLRYKGGEPAVLTFKSRSLFLYIYDYIIKEVTDYTEHIKRVYSENRGYARSFETKKNIPEKTLELMKNSNFLTHFNYVEYDELVDEEKVEIIEEDWKKLLKQVEMPILRKNSLRFRRLGKHRANGLYYPLEKSLCVDIKTTNSFIHEYFHMIDYGLADNNIFLDTLSSRLNFNNVKELYIKYSNEAIDELEKEDRMNLFTNQYNKDYYFSNKEIFARTGEIYMELKGVNSHLLGSKIGSSVFYPNNEELFEAIVEYFDNLEIFKWK